MTHTPEGEVHLGHQGPLLDGESPGIEELAPAGVVQPTLPHGDGPPRLEELLEPGQDLRGQAFGFLGVTAVSVLDPGVRVREGLARPEARPALIADREPKHTIGNCLPVPEQLDARELTNKNKHVLKKHFFVFFSQKTHLCVCFFLKNVFKDVFLVWFGWCWDNNKRTFCTIGIGLCKMSVCQPYQNKNNFFQHIFERKNSQMCFQHNVSCHVMSCHVCCLILTIFLISSTLTCPGRSRG